MSNIAKNLLGTVRYQYLSQLGEGATSKVARVLDTHLNRIVARKVFHKELSADQRLLQTFLNEAKLVGYLSHPGIVPVYGLSMDAEEQLTYTMPIVQGSSLTDVLQADPNTGNGQAMPMDKALSALIKLCETLSYAHDRGVLHLDLKPDNIVIGEYGEVLIMDWGTGRLKDPQKYADHFAEAKDKQITVDFEVEEDLFLGTPKYMSPEQTTVSRDQLDYQSDIFSIGIIAYQMFTGIHPFHANNIEGLFSAIQNEEVPVVHALNPILPLKLDEIIGKMLAKRVEERYATFGDVLGDLNDLRTAGNVFETKDFPSKHVIFRQNDMSDFAFTIMSGEVEVSIEVDGKHKAMAKLGPGDIVGELASITNQPRSATVTTLSPTRISVIHQDQINAELDKLSPWVGKLINTLAERFTNVNMDLASHKSERDV